MPRPSVIVDEVKRQGKGKERKAIQWKAEMC
jgi:hypothetical protein